MNKHRISASIDPDNTDSLKLMERIGLRKEGHFVKSLFWKNNWVDDVIYAVLREEWIKK
ncbi:GNAT family N-acetyltransferase [Chryseobacterium nakagawai]|uniref:GNAT family N-acetyltransferase n=1 Tax=Chryseobacterium nakagawai TaxID=1241982 RepID=UPI0021D129F9|nr:GNAT family protein [Chryseobacterium nakagawai]